MVISYVGKFGMHGSVEGQLSNPYGLTVDVNGFISIADSGNNQISIFDKFGNYINSFGSNGCKAGQFFNPHSSYNS